MSDCCDPSGYRRFFNTKEAKRHARSFQQKGLDSTEGPMVDALSNSLDGKSLLDVGAGSGGATVELLRRGAGSAVAVDISDAYRPVVQILLEDAGVADQASFVVGDLVEMDAEVGPADVVFGNRVICCYPDMPAMVDAMTSRAQERMAASYPRDRWMTRLGVRFLNLLLRLRRVGFQAYVHSPEEIKDRVEHAGFELMASGKTPIWLWQVWQRPAE